MSETQQAIHEKPARDRAPRGVSPLNGTPTPGGRPKGTPNRVTRSIREAVEKASHECHPRGLAGWLLERSRGGIQDRQIFAAMVMKALPLQVQANVDGTVKIELGWLGGRNVGATQAQIGSDRSQVLEMQADSDGVLRIKDPIEHEQPANPTAEKPDPHPPIEPGEGG